MYLIRIALDKKKKHTQLALNNPNLFHGAIEHTFKNQEERKLWRVDTLRGKSYLMIVSQTTPDLSSLIWQYAPEGSQAEVKDYDILLDRIKNGDTYYFKLCADPTRCRPIREGQKRGTLYSCNTKETQKDWLINKSKICGFEIQENNFQILSSRKIQFAKGQQENRIDVKMNVVTYFGILKVTDAETFKKALTGGIGRRKAFGTGMITIARS